MQQVIRQGFLRRLLDAIVRMSSTRINYWAEFVVDLLLGSVLLAAGWRHRGNHPLVVLMALPVGLLAFTFVEYFFHRWMFHTRVPLFADGHKTHHEKPLGYDSLPFFLPSAVLLMLTGLVLLVLPTGFGLVLMGAVTFGYIAYGLSHFIIHHVRFKHPIMRQWAANHHVHHYHPETNFGVTSPLWDVILGTRYVRQPRQF